MADPVNSDSDSSITGWSLVDKQGDLEHSDAASTSSGSDFVNLDSDAVSYHHKDKREQSPESSQLDGTLKETLKEDAPESVGEGGDSDGHIVVAEPETASPIDSLGSDVEILGAENLDDEQPSNLSHEEENAVDQPEEARVMSDSISSIEEIQAPSGDEPEIPAEAESGGLASPPVEEITAGQDAETAEIEQDGDASMEDVSSNDVTDFGPPGDASDSDHSDFVRLDANMVDEPVAGPSREEEHGADLMQESSSSNASSISHNFRFVQAIPIHNRFQPHYDYDWELPSDGGSVKDVRLREQQVYQMKNIQDDFLMCLKQQNQLEKRLKQPSVSEEKLAAVGAIWKDKYQELIIERADMEHKIKELENQISSHLSDATEQMRQAQEVAGKLAEDLTSLSQGTVEVSQLDFEKLQTEHRELHDQLRLREAQLKELSEASVRLDVSKDQDLESLGVALNEVTEEKDAFRQKAEALSAQLSSLRDDYDKVQAKHDQLKLESGLLGEKVKILEESLQDQKVSAEELTTSLQTEIENRLKTTTELKTIKNVLNQLETENLDLKQTISKLRYSEHPANEVENQETTKVDALKHKVNELAHENVDLKSVVGKIRYSQEAPANEVSKVDEKEDVSPVSDSTEEDGVESLKIRLTEITQQLNTEKYRNQLLQSMYIAEKEKASHGTAEFAPNFFTCVSFLLPNADFYKFSAFDDLMGNVSESVRDNFAFLKNITADGQFSDQLKKKWNTITEFITDPSKQPCVSCKAKKLLEEIQGQINQRWQEFQQYASEFQPPRADDTTDTDAGDESNTTINNKFEEYVNKTKESVSKLSKKIENTWHKVKNLSQDFLKKKDETIETVSDTLNEGIVRLKNHVHKGFKKVSKHFDWAKKPRHQKYNHKHHGHKNRNRHGPNPDYSSKHSPYDPPFMTDDRGEFERKPPHKQKQSSPDGNEYEEFWRQARFHPDDIVHEGFFEGNNREWRKHQKTLRNLHGRVEKLNEELFMDMDDDDIEDIYDDLEDFEDDIEDKKEQPQGLKTWLSCQLRWWKSRIQRKKREDQLVTECGRQLMNWQLKATCSHQCEHHKCQKHAIKLAKVCKTVMFTQGFKSYKSELTAKSLHQNHKVFQSIRVTGDSDKEGTISSEFGQFKYSVDHNADVDTEDEFAGETVNETVWEYAQNDRSSWYLRRVQAREDSHTKSPKWVFGRMQDREDKRHPADWVFERADERDYERNKPWYEKRAENRQSRIALSQSDDEIGRSP